MIGFHPLLDISGDSWPWCAGTHPPPQQAVDESGFADVGKPDGRCSYLNKGRWQSVTKCGRMMWQNVAKFGTMWRNVAKCGNIWQNVVCGKMDFWNSIPI